MDEPKKPTEGLFMFGGAADQPTLINVQEGAAGNPGSGLESSGKESAHHIGIRRYII